MNFRRIQGWALVVSALIALLSLVAGSISFFHYLNILGILLFIIGVPAIQSVQPMGTAGLIGILLLELAAVISLVLNLSGGSGLGDSLPLISALAGLLGRLIVGWLTTQKRVFPAWVGWAFMLEGLLNFIGGIVHLGSLGSLDVIVATLLAAAALFGYGLGITQKS